MKYMELYEELTTLKKDLNERNDRYIEMLRELYKTGSKEDILEFKYQSEETEDGYYYQYMEDLKKYEALCIIGKHIENGGRSE